MNVSRNSSSNDLTGVLSRERLSRLKFKAVRGGVWFKALSKMDRVLMDLTIRVTDVVRSFRLASLLLPIVNKLKDCLEGKVSRVLKEVGFPLAHKLGLLAQKWGNDSACRWMSDESFAKFLAIMHINKSWVPKG